MTDSGPDSSDDSSARVIDGLVEDDLGAAGTSDFRIETERLILRRWHERDFPVFAELCRDPIVMRYLPPGPLDPEIAMARAAMFDGDFELRRLNGLPYGLAAVERKDDGEFLGFTGINHHRWFPNDIEIGWRFARHSWGNGYAGEAASAIVEYSFEKLMVPRLISVAMPDNARSIKVMERIGMSLDHRDVHEDIATVVFALTMEEYRSRSIESR